MKTLTRLLSLLILVSSLASCGGTLRIYGPAPAHHNGSGPGFGTVLLPQGNHYGHNNGRGRGVNFYGSSLGSHIGEGGPNVVNWEQFQATGGIPQRAWGHR